MKREKNQGRIKLIGDFILPLIRRLFLFSALLFVLFAIRFLILRTIQKAFPNRSFEVAFFGSIIINLALWAFFFFEKTIRRN